MESGLDARGGVPPLKMEMANKAQDRFGTDPEPIWDRSRTDLGPFRDRSGTDPGPIQDRSRTVPGPIWDRSWALFAISIFMGGTPPLASSPDRGVEN